MALKGRMDTKITILRSANPATDDDPYGDANAADLEPQSDRPIKAAFHSPRGRSADDGEGDRSLTKMVLFVDTKTDIQIGDIIKVESGVNPGAPYWRVTTTPYRPRDKHAECLVGVYNGKVE